MVSIIMCTFNDSHFLPKAISSCLEQDIDKELILVDDASTKPLDPTVQLMIGQFNIKYIKHTTNQGLSAARNTGIAAAKNKWVIPLDADDWFYPNTIKTLLDNGSDADVLCGNCTDGGVWVPGISTGLSKEKFMKDNQLVCSSLFRKKMWEDIGGYMVRKGPHYEDWNFWARGYAAGFRFKYVNCTVYNHTSRADSMLRILHPNREYYVKVATEGVFK